MITVTVRYAQVLGTATLHDKCADLQRCYIFHFRFRVLSVAHDRSLGQGHRCALDK